MVVLYEANLDRSQQPSAAEQITWQDLAGQDGWEKLCLEKEEGTYDFQCIQETDVGRFIFQVDCEAYNCDTMKAKIGDVYASCEYINDSSDAMSYKNSEVINDG